MDSSPGGSKPPTTTTATATATTHQHQHHHHRSQSAAAAAPLAPPSSSGGDSEHAAAKRPVSQSQLLPPLELLSSSPGLPNAASTSRRLSRPGSSSKAPSAIHNNNNNNSLASHAYLKYPTPVPTSSTGILSSSPPRVINSNGAAAIPRPPLQRAPSVVSERAPLSAVPSIELNENGETLLMGRSSNSSHYQLSANRLISRVHVKARYIPASVPLQPNKIEIECHGWNGLKLHSQGRTYDMHKGDLLTFETEGVEIMLDVQDARVLVHWPKKDARDGLVDLGWEDSPRSVRHGGASPIVLHGSPRAGSENIGLGLLQSSPLRRTTRISSPESPTPAHASLQQSLNGELPSSSQHSSILSDLPSISERQPSVEIYEDEDADDQSSSVRRPSTADQSFVTDVTRSFSSDLSEPQSDDDLDENNPDEENDPIILSFGPYGANLNDRLALASFSASSPKRRRLESGSYASSKVTASRSATVEDSFRSSKSASTPRQGGFSHNSPALDEPSEKGKEAACVPDLSHVDVVAITNHVVNQLAFSRLSSTPLSTLLSNLPAEDKHGLSRDELRYIVESTACIGTITRQGKDAVGKPLESQYYYIPEADGDESRRAAVVDGLRKPTLRNCRKHHVQYYWKRPRTP